jgi:hypothetical protein
MRKAMAILVFSTVILTSCGKVSEPAENVKTSAVSQTTTTVTTSASTSAKEEKDTIVTTTKISTQTVSKTSKPTKTTTTETTTQSRATSVNSTASPTQQIYYPTEQTEQQTQVTTAVQTTTVPKTETTTQTTTSLKVTTTKPQNTVQWSDTMKAWRKLCEGKSISNSEWELVRQDIVNYGVQKFNGKTTVDLSCGIEFYTRTFQSPMNLSANTSLKGMSHAHLDAYAEPECSAMINYASSEEEIYEIVEQTRIDCLSVVDSGIESWYEFCETNDSLKYASYLEFNVGLDGTAIWFLTE